MSTTGRWGPGYEIAGRYRLIDLLGRGGMGEVWRAEHLGLHVDVAAKLIDQRVASDQVSLQRFMQEARAAAALQSPHVVRTTDFGVDDGTPFIIMELLKGESLQQRLERQKRLDPIETARTIRHVARAIQKAHDAGFVHRDLKPDNIFIVTDDDQEIVKVLDFGVAKAIGGASGDGISAATATGAMIGTPFYMSPEQAQGDRRIDHRSDLWSLGVITFECVTGTLPFVSEGLGALLMKICAAPIPAPSSVVAVPPGFDEWFARALDRDPDKRFQSAKQMSEALSALLTGSLEHTDRVVRYLTPAGTPPALVASHGQSSPWHQSNQALERTTGQTSSADIDIGRRGARRAWIAILAVGGIVGIIALALVARFALGGWARAEKPINSTGPSASAAMIEVAPVVEPALIAEPAESTQENPAASLGPAPTPPAERGRPVASRTSTKSSAKPSASAAPSAAPAASTAKPRICVPGATQLCVGSGACRGAQVCAAGGTVWGACECAKK